MKSVVSYLVKIDNKLNFASRYCTLSGTSASTSFMTNKHLLHVCIELYLKLHYLHILAYDIQAEKKMLNSKKIYFVLFKRNFTLLMIKYTCSNVFYRFYGKQR